MKPARLLLALLLACAACGPEAPGDFGEIPPADAGPEIAAIPDAGSEPAAPDAGSAIDPCLEPSAQTICQRAADNLTACCIDWQTSSVVGLCHKYAEGDSKPVAACKLVADMPCHDLIAMGQCL